VRCGREHASHFFSFCTVKMSNNKPTNPLPIDVHIPNGLLDVVPANPSQRTSTSSFIKDRFKENPFVFAGSSHYYY
jgi:hypothetical protein